MIHVIYGAKGSGKTKANSCRRKRIRKTAKGVVVYFDRSNHRMHDLHRNIRLVDASFTDLIVKEIFCLLSKECSLRTSI